MAQRRSRDVDTGQDVDFDTLVRNKALLQGLLEAGYERPSPIQLQAIPLGRIGVDLIAQAKSGTGKTVVFGVVALEAIDPARPDPQVLMVAPTREIALQIRDVMRDLGKHIPRLKCEALIGGLDVRDDIDRLRKAQLLVGTPGRLMQHIEEKKLRTDTIKLVVLDEADKLMSGVFEDQTHYILQRMPRSKQCIVISATFTPELLESVGQFLKKPQMVRLTTDVAPSLEEVQQYVKELQVKFEPGDVDARKALRVYKAKFDAAADILSKIPFHQCMIFIKHLPRAHELSQWLTDLGWAASSISGNLSQEKRNKTMMAMRDFKLRVLVCSDLIARGIDIDRVNLVINMDYPDDIETYMHRVGRTGRFGTSGIAVNLVGPEDKAFLDRLRGTNVELLPLPENVTYSEFRKELNENERKRLERHERARKRNEDKELEFKLKLKETRVDEDIPQPEQPEAEHAQRMVDQEQTQPPATIKKRKPPQPAAKKRKTHVPAPGRHDTSWQIPAIPPPPPPPPPSLFSMGAPSLGFLPFPAFPTAIPPHPLRAQTQSQAQNQAQNQDQAQDQAAYTHHFIPPDLYF
ncbi:P-loop containing nucleoside triphosphate hydrolase protein [Syncephalastrum racemosum]|uniref:RNA helicase n=1 Tax=Syncephalastrum racemosum TaxID=13706 RepID=A0A1X2HME3_SYNRA|nr:P-loop containing nucleoside triphosphate hydrolase protein [Syncephalastrum racemosum]